MKGHNSLKKGDRVRLSPGDGRREPRYGTITNNKRGARRTVHVEARGGYYDEIGDTYVDEIAFVDRDGEWEPIEMSKAHREQMARIRMALRGMGW